MAKKAPKKKTAKQTTKKKASSSTAKTQKRNLDGSLPKAPGGRKPAKIDLKLVERLAGMHCTLDEMAYALGITTRTFRERRSLDPRINEAIERGKTDGLLSLRRALWKKALGGKGKNGKPDASLLRFLAKNHLGMTDSHRHEVSGKDGGPIETVTTVSTKTVAWPPNGREGAASQPGAEE